MRTTITTLLICLLTALTACQQETPPTPEPEPDGTQALQEDAFAPPPDAEAPFPPLYENFQGEPQLTLFPRVGDFRPADGHERLPYWRTFIDHLNKTAGLLVNRENENRAWSFRSINTIESLGYFSPVGVAPNTTYAITFKLKANLPEGASAGIGIIEFDEFLWITEQYTEQTFKDHFRGAHEGIRLNGDIDWAEHRFTFTTGPETQMVHLILFREGTHDRKGVLFDDIGIEEAGGA